MGGMQNRLNPQMLQQQMAQANQMRQQQQGMPEGGVPGVGGWQQAMQNIGGQLGGARPGAPAYGGFTPPDRGAMPLPPSAQPRMQPPAYGAGGRFGMPGGAPPMAGVDSAAGGAFQPPSIGMPRGIPEDGMARPELMQQKMQQTMQQANSARDAFRASNPMPPPGPDPGKAGLLARMNMKPFRGGPNEGKIAGPDRAEAISALAPAMGGMKPPGGANFYSNAIKGTTKNPAAQRSAIGRKPTPQLQNRASLAGKNPRAAAGAKAASFAQRRRM